jgi:regulator of protease activity HflC (stomatin/prohibitin superfamily)
MSMEYVAQGGASDLEETSEAPVGRAQRLIHASRRFTGRILLALVVAGFVAIYFWPQVFITIHSGEVGVLYMRFGGGTQTDRVLGQGLKIIAPWDTLFIYDVRVQETKHTMDVLTNEGLTVKLELSIRYHPELDLVGLLHDRIGPQYKDIVVIPEVESALRETMGQFMMRDVYGSQRGLVQEAINSSLEQIEGKYIKIDDVVIREVTLPEAVRENVEQKMLQKELAESYEYRIDVAKREAERLQIEASGRKTYNDTLNASLTPNILKWEGIEATKELAKSAGSKTIIIGNKDTGLPLILGSDK